MRISDWSSDVCSSVLQRQLQRAGRHRLEIIGAIEPGGAVEIGRARVFQRHEELPVRVFRAVEHQMLEQMGKAGLALRLVLRSHMIPDGNRHHRSLAVRRDDHPQAVVRSEEHTSELQSLMRISYAVFCLQKKK